jgi:hypothetical protein
VVILIEESIESKLSFKELIAELPTEVVAQR